jgi:PKD repeat protein
MNNKGDYSEQEWEALWGWNANHDSNERSSCVMCIYVYVFIHVYTYIYIYTYIYMYIYVCLFMSTYI